MKERKQFKKVTRFLGSGVEVRERDLGEFDGFLDCDNIKYPRITINKNLPDEEKVITLLHEIYHHFYPEFSEETIEHESGMFYKGLSERERGKLRAFLAAFRKH